MKKKLTSKQRVLKKHPEAYAEALTETCWYVYVLSKPNKIEVPLGNGMSARDAWSDAVKRL